MLSEAAPAVTVATAMLILVTRVQAAPAHADFLKPSDPLPSLAGSPAAAAAAAARSPALAARHHLRLWPLGSRAAAADATTRTSSRMNPAPAHTGPAHTGPAHTGPAHPDTSKQAQMLRMISVLQELQGAYNSTLSSWITFLPRANSRSSGRKHKVPPAAEGRVTPPTGAPAAAGSTDAVVPSLTGRNFKKSLPPQPKKTNKRVCFWKYCSQN